MGNKLRQVLRMYPWGWTLSVVVCWLLLHGFMIWTCKFVPSSRLAELRALILGTPWTTSEQRLASLSTALSHFSVPIVCLGVAIAHALKLPFANPRARVLPGFATPHLIAAGAVIVAAVAGSTWAIVWTCGAPGTAVAAFVLIEMAATVCFAYLELAAGGYGVLFAILVMAPGQIMDPVFEYVAAVILAENPAMIVIGLCVGLASLAALGARLSMLREEMRDYSSRPLISIRTAGRLSERQGGGRTMARWGLFSRLGDAEFRLVFRHLPAWAPLRRLLLRQLNDGFDARLLAPLQFGMVLVLVALQPSAPPTLHGDFPGGLPLLVALLVPIFFATATVGNMALPRLYLPRESLYPLSRLGLVGDLALSAACSTAMLAAAHCAGVLAAVALVRAEGPLAALVLPYLALTIVQYAVAYCAIVWLALLRSVWAQAMGWFATSILSSALVTMALSLDWHSSPSSVPMIVILTVVFVALPVRAALGRWCRVELG